MSVFSDPKRPEIDNHTIKLIVGLIALSLPVLVSIFSPKALGSISESYHMGGWSRDVFVGFLFAIAAFLLAFNGRSRYQMALSKIAAFAAMGVAIFPCDCGGYDQLIMHVHAVSAGVMFLILAAFCYSFYRRALSKGHPQAKVRAVIYAICGTAIALVILVLAIDGLMGGALQAQFERLTYYGEAIGLVAFGIAWLTASRSLPVITTKAERLSPFSA